MADLAGEDTDRITRHGLSFNPTRAGIIHHRARLTEESRLRRGVGISLQQVKAEDWFVFGVIRDPRLRMFSAWQDKYLLRNPGNEGGRRPLHAALRHAGAEAAHVGPERAPRGTGAPR